MTLLDILAQPPVRRWLPGTLNVAALLLLTAMFARWTWLLAKPPLPPAVAVSFVGARGTGFDVQPLLSAHLFGQAPQSPTGVDSLPLSSLNLVLNGVIAVSGGGYALISVNGRPQEPFAVGDPIIGGAVLQGVYADRVVILRGGVMESLLLKNPIAASGVGIPGAAPVSPMLAGLQRLARNHYVVSRARLTRAITGPDFLKQVSLAPLASGGFLVRQVQAGSYYARMGLRAGDVIRRINGQPVNTVDDMMRLYQHIGQLGDLQVDIVRAGRPTLLDYRVQ